MKSEYLIKLSGICGIMLPIVTISGLLLALPRAPWFSWTENAISDLGRPEFGLSFFNYTLILIGILLLAFSFGLLYSLKGERVGPTVFALSSIYFIGVGLFPLPDPNHVDVSGLFFIAFPLGFLMLGLKMYKKRSRFIKNMGISALIIAIIGGISPIFLLFYEGIAIPEVVILFPGFFWCMRYGFHLITSEK
jgi:hypothetical membrane protein